MRARQTVEENLELLYERACQEFFRIVERIKGDHVVVGVPGGRSIVPFLYALVGGAEALPLDHWYRLQFFVVDERLVPLDAEDSNYRLIKTSLSQLTEELILRESQLHPFIYQPAQEDLGVARYEQELLQFGGKFHIACLGAGEDGHVAALFPDHHSIEDSSLCFFTMDDSPKYPPGRMTSSRALLIRADAAFAFFVGDGKREALGKYRDASVKVSQCPAKLIDQVTRAHVFTNLA